ncbi:hypothetical protein [Anaerovibrio sp.]|uniref:hypothetical protein n=1 Tax=Anaerovibrio sp. TaxID=1872532 RepID=UPI003F14546E
MSRKLLWAKAELALNILIAGGLFFAGIYFVFYDEPLQALACFVGSAVWRG